MTMQKKRTTNFREDETKLLIQLWGSPSIQTQMSACHRKAPIMIQLASMMQQYGFYRTPEEITTRIRNLKCIYHRIKKTLSTGLITDPDWHHFKAMDAILGDGMTAHRYSIGMNGFPRKEIKKEVVDVEDIINSKYSNDSHSSGCDDDDDGDTVGNYIASSPMQGLTITSSTPVIAGPSSTSRVSSSAALHKAKYGDDDEPTAGSEEPKRQRLQRPTVGRSRHREDSLPNSPDTRPQQEQSEVTSLLQQLLDVEREHLEIEKQRLEFDRKVGCQLMALIPIVGSVLQNQFLLQQQQQQHHHNHQQQQQQQQEQQQQHQQQQHEGQDTAESPENNSERDSDQNSCDEGTQNNEVRSLREELSADLGCGILQSFTNFGS
ncbi:hypothetical protein B7P43_G15653 [Cryptotermes secundus]|uniref:Myb/SANT-like DNA-binding domain-containing protein n=1 Tax=Cryptotermes secundus TaxID=105785 RepID=A0A2J7RQR2_9NEOP|nr:myb-like protein Q [Cryptotermes secundus]PNF43181.1 hypothetical protein B7P43_G15653 [Cryptotermes secundus]